MWEELDGKTIARNVGEEIEIVTFPVVDEFDEKFNCPLCGAPLVAAVMQDGDCLRTAFYCTCEEYEAFDDFMITEALNNGR